MFAIRIRSAERPVFSAVRRGGLLSDRGGLGEERGRTAGVEKNHSFLRPDLTSADEVNKPGHSLAGVHWIKQYALGASQKLDSLRAARRKNPVPFSDVSGSHGECRFYLVLR